MSKFDLDSISFEPKIKESSMRSSKKPFFAGPISLDWLMVASCLPGKALQCALALQHQSKLSRSKSLKIQPEMMRRFGVQRKARYSAIENLQEAKLIKIEKKSSGTAVTIRLLELNPNQDGSSIK